MNNIETSRFDVRKGTLSETIKESEQFDIILANIHRNVLIDIAPQIFRRSSRGAAVVLSGLLVYDVLEVREMYERVGFSFVREERENEWGCLVLKIK